MDEQDPVFISCLPAPAWSRFGTSLAERSFGSAPTSGVSPLDEKDDFPKLNEFFLPRARWCDAEQCQSDAGGLTWKFYQTRPGTDDLNGADQQHRAGERWRAFITLRRWRSG